MSHRVAVQVSDRECPDFQVDSREMQELIERAKKLNEDGHGDEIVGRFCFCDAICECLYALQCLWRLQLYTVW